jgi:hypothetical protein
MSPAGEIYQTKAWPSNLALRVRGFAKVEMSSTQIDLTQNSPDISNKRSRHYNEFLERGDAKKTKIFLEPFEIRLNHALLLSSSTTLDALVEKFNITLSHIGTLTMGSTIYQDAETNKDLARVIALMESEKASPEDLERRAAIQHAFYTRYQLKVACLSKMYCIVQDYAKNSVHDYRVFATEMRNLRENLKRQAQRDKRLTGRLSQGSKLVDEYRIEESEVEDIIAQGGELREDLLENENTLVIKGKLGMFLEKVMEKDFFGLS